MKKINFPIIIILILSIALMIIFKNQIIYFYQNFMNGGSVFGNLTAIQDSDKHIDFWSPAFRIYSGKQNTGIYNIFAFSDKDTFIIKRLIKDNNVSVNYSIYDNEDIDIASIEIPYQNEFAKFGRGYIYDKDNVYYSELTGLVKIEELSPDTIQYIYREKTSKYPFSPYEFVRDDNHLYFKGRVCEDTDLNNIDVDLLPKDNEWFDSKIDSDKKIVCPARENTE